MAADYADGRGSGQNLGSGLRSKPKTRFLIWFSPAFPAPLRETDFDLALLGAFAALCEIAFDLNTLFYRGKSR